MLNFLLLTASFFLSIFVLFFVTKLKLHDIFYDFPNKRSSHSKPTLKIGGLLIFLILVPIGFFSNYFYSPASLACLLIIFLISFIDDLIHVSNLLRLVTHFIVAFIFIVFLPINDFYLIIFFTISLVWITNLYNFMDGIDGLSIFMTIVGFSSLAIQFYLNHFNDFVYLPLLLVITIFPYIFFNFYKSKIFLGDAGAASIGFLAGSVGLVGWVNNVWPIWFPTLIFSTFGADATLTVLIKLINKKNPLLPHKEYFFHKLIDLGLGKKTTATVYLFFMVLSSLLGFVMINLDHLSINLIFYSYMSILLILLILIHFRWMRVKS